MRLNIIFPAGLVCMLIAGVCFGQTDEVTLYGYIEPQYSMAEIRGESREISSLKLRLDLEILLSELVTLQGNVNCIARQGDTAWYLVDFMSEDIMGSLFPGARELFVYHLEDEIFLDNLFLRTAFERFDLTIGRQQISPGAGYAWNPTDIFNSKDMMDPTYEQRGHDALRIDIPLGLTSSWMLLYNPDGDFDSSGKLTALKKTIGHFDMTLMWGERTQALSDFISFKKTNEKRRITGMDIIGELFGIGVWAEIARNEMEMSDNYFEGIIGFDYTFDNQVYVLNELYRNEQGKSDHREYTPIDWLKYFSGEKKSITRDQWFLYMSYPATDLLTIGGSVITSLNDRSQVVIPTLEYNIFEDLDLTVFGNFYMGDEGKAYSPLLGQGGLLRLRYFF